MWLWHFRRFCDSGLLFSYILWQARRWHLSPFDYSKGIWVSPWNGIENLNSCHIQIDFRDDKNTLMYYVIFTALGTFLNVVIAIATTSVCSKSQQGNADRYDYPGFHFLCGSAYRLRTSEHRSPELQQHIQHCDKILLDAEGMAVDPTIV